MLVEWSFELVLVEWSFERGGGGYVLRRTRSSHPWSLRARHPWRARVLRNTYPPPPRIMSPSTVSGEFERALCARSSHRISQRRYQAPTLHIE